MSEPEVVTFAVVDCFTSLDDLKPKDWLDYQKVTAAVLAAGKFSAFDAHNQIRQQQLTAICRDPELITDTVSVGYPWVLVRRKTAAVTSHEVQTESSNTVGTKP